MSGAAWQMDRNAATSSRRRWTAARIARKCLQGWKPSPPVVIDEALAEHRQSQAGHDIEQVVLVREERGQGNERRPGAEHVFAGQAAVSGVRSQAEAAHGNVK